ncbi:hypothetical protein LCGC14_2992670 [marine sediment metagenome]|uniref:Uncharacterized protein n=1 Tax=marine sediment metagenome TaxID=412755 RepID=A0A0F8X3B3_9ZZZZ
MPPQTEKPTVSLIINRIVSDPLEVVLLDTPTAALCRLVYPGHPKGCPNLGKVDRCPPKAPLYNSGDYFTIAAVQYDLAARAAQLKALHPEWTDRQCRCCLYWQGSVRKALREWIKKIPTTRRSYVQRAFGLDVDETPEAKGANVFAMMEKCGHPMERQQPLHTVWKVAFLS